MGHGSFFRNNRTSHGNEVVSRVFVPKTWQQVVDLTRFHHKLDRVRYPCDGSGPGFIWNADGVLAGREFYRGELAGRKRGGRLAIDVNGERKNTYIPTRGASNVH